MNLWPHKCQTGKATGSRPEAAGGLAALKPSALFPSLPPSLPTEPSPAQDDVSGFALSLLPFPSRKDVSEIATLDCELKLYIVVKMEY